MLKLKSQWIVKDGYLRQKYTIAECVTAKTEDGETEYYRFGRHSVFFTEEEIKERYNPVTKTEGEELGK